MRPPPPHRATTAHLQAVYPFVSDRSPASTGPLMGRDVLGGPFRFDPWELYEAGRITSPNMLVLGQLGRGKSSLVKALVRRHVSRGRRAWIIDPKGEYGPLARACGTEPVTIRPGGTTRLNPLDVPGRFGRVPHESGEDVRRRTELVSSLVGSSLRRALGPEERTAVELAVRHAGRRPEEATLPALVEALLHPDPQLASDVGTDVVGLSQAGRSAALELRRMVQGDLAGMFDGPTSAGVDLNAPVVVLDLSSTFGSAALPLIMACTTAWLQAALAEGGGGPRLVVIDEAWAILNDPATARWCQATFKLSRSFGVANVAVVHRVSDLTAVAADGSAEGKLAAGLLSDSETRVIFGQPHAEAEATAGLLGLGSTEAEVISRLPRGMALWRVGSRSYLVEHLMTAGDRVLVDTDAAMRT